MKKESLKSKTPTLTIDDLLDNYKGWKVHKANTWENILVPAIEKLKDVFRYRQRGKQIKELRRDIIESFEEELFKDLIYNSNIFRFHGTDIFMFFAQKEFRHKRRNGNDPQVYKRSGMYKVYLYLYYSETGRQKAKTRMKKPTLIKRRFAHIEFKKALRGGKKFPTFDECVEEINEYISYRESLYGQPQNKK